MRIVIVTGGRGYQRVDLVHAWLAQLEPGFVVHGACPTGADQDAHNWAIMSEVPVLAWPAQWRKFGRSAGPRRNEEMVRFVAELAEENFDITAHGLAFPGGRGTEDCKRRIRQFNLPLTEVTE